MLALAGALQATAAAPNGELLLHGAAVAGAELRADASAITDADGGVAAVTYHWRRVVERWIRGRQFLRMCEGDDCIDLGTGATYLLTGDDVDRYVGVQATVTDGQGDRGYVTAVLQTRIGAGAVSTSTGVLRVPEGDSRTYEVVLAGAPEGDVVVEVGGTAGTDVSVHPARLTFTTTDWGAAQTVTVSVAADADQASDPTVTLAHAPTGGGFDDLGGDLVTVLPGEEDGILAAVIVDVPRWHGSDTVVIDVSFGREVAVTRTAMRDDVFAVVGGQVSGVVRKTASSNASWEVELAPSGTDDLVFSLPATSDCAAAGAVCTAGGLKLTAGPSATIPAEWKVGGVRASAGAGHVVVGWTQLADATSYKVQWKSGTQSFADAAADGREQTVAGTADRASVPGLVPGRVYLFRVVGVAADGAQSMPSDTDWTSPWPTALLTATLELPAAHDGSTRFDGRVVFSEDVSVAAGSASDGIEVTAGRLVHVDGSDPAVWSLGIEPIGVAAVTVRFAANRPCSAAGSMCTGDGRRLSAVVEATVSGPQPVAPSDDATLSGLTLSGIDIGPFAPDTTGYAADVAHAVSGTTVTATPTDADAAVVIADADGSTPGTTRSATLAVGANTITATVTAADGATTRIYTATVTRAAAVDPLTAAFEAVPSAHDGSAGFELTLRFSESLAPRSRSKLRGGAVAVSGGTLGALTRANPDRTVWTVPVQPAGTADVVVSLAAGTACDAGGVCTADGRTLSAGALATVPGPDAAEPPDQIGEPALTAATNHIDATWTEPAANGAAISGYDVEYGEPGEAWTDAGHAGTATSLRIAGLAADTAYEVRVRAVNDAGDGAWSPAAAARTLALPEPPDQIGEPALTAATNHIDATWTEPAANGAAISGYDVEYGEPGEAWTDAGHAGTATSLRIAGLAADTAYEVRVRAVNDAGDGAWSPAAAARTLALPEPPDQIGEPALTAATNHIDATWTEPAANGAAISGYDVEYGEPGEAWTDAGHAGTATSLRIAGLAADTAYEVRVRAVNDAGDGAWSPAASARTLAAGTAAEGDVRLVGGAGAHEGRVEVHHDGQWGTVCDDYWNAKDAEVVCRQLGYAGTATAHRGSAFGEGADPIWMDNVQCRGGEARLADCRFAGWGMHNCRHAEDAGASCATPALSAVGATLSGTRAALVYDAALDAGSVPSPRDFVVAARAADGTSAALEVAAVSMAGRTVVLTLSRPVGPGGTASLSYLPAAMRPLQDASLNAAAALTIIARPRSAPPAGAPAVVAVPRDPVAAVSGAAKVERLDLSDRGLSDLGALAGLADLELLDLGGNAVVDLWPLAGLRGLRVLDLSGNRIEDVSALAGLTGLERLDLSGNRIADIGPLAALAGLEVLLLDGNRIADPAALVPLSGLAHLGLSGNRVVDVGELAGLAGLQRLDLAGNPVADAWALGDLGGLLWLRLPGDSASDADALGRLSRLRWLWLEPHAAAPPERSGAR